MGIEPKKKKSKLKIAIAIIVGLVILGALIGGDSSGNKDKPSQKVDGGNEVTSEEPKKEKLTLDEGWTIDKSNQFAVYIEGYVSNNTDKEITNYVQITFDALDANKANLGTCLANTNTIDANGKWKFKAICTDAPEEIDTVRFKNISGF